MVEHRTRLGSGWGRAFATVSLVAAGAVVTTGGAAAAPITITVTTTVDGHGAGSLREAVDQVNAGTFDAITIELPAGTYELDVCGAGLQDETNVAGDLDPTTGTAPLTIVGLGGGATIHQSCPGQRVLDKRGGGRLTLRNVTVTGGNVVGRPAIGGAIRAGSPVTLEQVALTGNVAQGTDGSPAINNATGAAARGGAVYAVGAVIVRDSSVSGNRAIGGKGSYDYVPDQPSNGGPSSGGAIETTGRLTVSNTTFTDNRALGGVFQGNGAGGEAVGGAAVAGSADVRSTLFDGNMADAADSYVGFACPICPFEGYPAVYGRGGALSTGTGSVRLEGVDAHDNAAYGGFGASGGSIAAGHGIGGVVSGGAVEVVGGTYTDNAATVMGGAVFSTSISVSRAVLSRNSALDTGGAVASSATTIRDSTLSANVAHVGGAVAGGTMIIEDSTFSGNGTGVGSTSYFGDTTPAMGGAVSSGNLTAARSTFVDNTVTAPPLCTSPFGCTVSPVVGGAIASNGTVTLDAVTVARNIVGRTALSSPNGGGGIYATGAVTATNSTIADNDAFSGSGVQAPSVDLTAVTLVGNGATRQGPGITSPVVHARQSMLGAPSPTKVCGAGAVGTSGGYNWANDATCGLADATDQVSNANVLLGPLQDNGGPTPTRLPAAASPLVDAVPPASCAVVTDQRGASRPQAAGCEIGAVEVLGPAAPSDLGVAIAGPPTGEVGTPIELVVTVSAAGGIGYPTLLVTLPSGWGDLTNVVAPAGVHCVAPDATSIRCDRMDGVPDGSSFDVHLTLTLPPGSQLDVTASVTGRGEDPEAGNDTAVHAIALTTTTTTSTTSTTSTSTTSTSTSTSTSSTSTTAPTTTTSSTSTTSTTEPTTTTSSTSTTSTTEPATTTTSTSTTSTTSSSTSTSTSTTSTTEPTTTTSTTEPTTSTSSTVPPSSTTTSTSSTSTTTPSTSSTSTTTPSTSSTSSTSTTMPGTSSTSSTTAPPSTTSTSSAPSTSTTKGAAVGPASTDPDAAAVAGAGLTAGTLPVTGSPSGTPVTFAALLFAVGAAVLVVSRRARR